MKKFTCLAIDMGAGSIRGMLGKFDEKLILTEVFRFDNKIIEKDGHERWDLNAIHKGITTGVQKALKENPDIESIAVDSWGVDFVLIGTGGEPLEFPVAYRDSRTNGMQEKWTSEFFSKEETFRRTGINFYPFNSLFQLLSMKGDPIWEKTDKLLFTANYIAYFLSGQAVNELSLSSTSQLMDVNKKDWDTEILDKLGISPCIFGKPMECGNIIGNLKPEFGNQQVKICLAPSHDTASAIEAIPNETDNFVYIATGTWCIMGMPSETPVTAEIALNGGITNEINTSKKIKVNNNIMGLWLIQKLREVLTPGLPYGEVDKLAAEAKTKVLINPNDASLYNPENMQTAIDRLIEQQGLPLPTSAGEYFRIAYESLAQSFKQNLDVLVELRGKTFEALHIICGGAQSKMLCQLTANATQLPVYAGPIEGAAIGNMLWQARAMGVFDSESEITKLVKQSFDVKTFLPKIG
jgi:rhamnulokinase